MKRQIAAALTVLAVTAVMFSGCKKEEPQKAEAPQSAAPVPNAAQPSADQAVSGQALYSQHCAVCHPDGGNIVKPEFTLHKSALAAHKISKPEDIVNKMRNPAPGMTKFDAATVSDKDATAIAEYVLATFK